MSDDLRPDIAAAKDKMKSKIGGGREIKKLVNYLTEGETVERMATGAYGKGQGLLVLTDRRLFFVQDGLTSKSTEDFPFSKVSSVSWNSGLATGTITVHASGNTAEIKNVMKGGGKEIVALMRARLSDPGPAAAPTAAPAASSSTADELKKLVELRDAGVLDDDEFAAQKAKLLG